LLAGILSSDTIARFLYQQSRAPRIETDSFVIEKKLPHSTLEEKISARDGGRVQKGSFCRSTAQARTRLYQDIFHILFHVYIGTIDSKAIERILTLTAKARSEYEIMTPELREEFCNTLSRAIAVILS
jgi:hypothetical protein